MLLKWSAIKTLHKNLNPNLIYEKKTFALRYYHIKTYAIKKPLRMSKSLFNTL